MPKTWKLDGNATERNQKYAAGRCIRVSLTSDCTRRIDIEMIISFLHSCTYEDYLPEISGWISSKVRPSI